MSGGSSLPPEEPATVFFVGQHETNRSTPVTSGILSEALDLGYNFLTTEITTKAFHERVLSLVSDHYEVISQRSYHGPIPLPAISPLTPDHTPLNPQDSNSALIGIISPWIDLSSQDPIIAHISRQVLKLEVEYAAFCGVNNVIIQGPQSSKGATQFGRAIHEALGLGPYLQIHILMPMTGELDLDLSDTTQLSELAGDFEGNMNAEDEGEESSHPYDAWNIWNAIRTLCNYSAKLSIVLEVPRQLPILSLQSRWYAEPVKFLVFPRTSFLRNAKGYPVLSKPHQQLLSRFGRLRYPPWLLLSDVGPILATDSTAASSQSSEPTPAEASSKSKEKSKDPISHLRYMRHLQQNQPPRPPMERFGQGYQDYLQSPLQPLTDNLESITYEVFEKDPVKYEWYERAIAAALKDLIDVFEEPQAINIAVVGAGRGPLVTRALRASQKTGIPIRCWAVEKNQNAFVLLQRRNATDPLWSGQVNVVKSDMRHWPGPTIDGGRGKVDIVVSELLGSFADNELSPECLDGVQHVLHPDHGISIPQSYDAHLTPIFTPRLHSDLLSRGGSEKWDIPYVVMLHQYDYLSIQSETDGVLIPDVKCAWLFSHPLPHSILEQSRVRASGSADGGGFVGGNGSNEHNSRSCRVTFKCRNEGVCHGLGGYFETVLYDGKNQKVELSTNPVTMDDKSKDMISWFPIFFPLETPLYIPESSDIEVSMWRQTDDRSVWYEWIVEVFEGTKGRKRRLAISDLHSSRKHSCLM